MVEGNGVAASSVPVSWHEKRADPKIDPYFVPPVEAGGGEL
jgi:hypothetical protein